MNYEPFSCVCMQCTCVHVCMCVCVCVCDFFCTDITPTLLDLKTMKGADGTPLRIMETVAAGDYMTFGMCLLRDKNGVVVKLIKRNNIQDGTESVTQAIIGKWLTSGRICTYQHLIVCLKQSELGALAEDIVKNCVQQ